MESVLHHSTLRLATGPRILLLAAGLALAAGCAEKTPEHASVVREPIPETVHLADSRLLQGDLPRARALIDRALADDPECFSAWYRLAFSQLIDFPDSAGMAAKRAERAAPEHPGPPLLQALLLMPENRTAESDSFMTRAWLLAQRRTGYSLPETTQVIAEAILAMEQRRPRDAVVVLRDHARADSTNPVLGFLYARSVYLAGDIYTAHDLLGNVIAADSTFAPAHALDSACLYRNGKRPAARVAAERALALDPGEPWAHHVLGHIDLDESSYRDAFRHWWLALLEDPTEPEFYKYLGGTLIRFGEPNLGSQILQMMEWTLSFLRRYLEWV